MTKKTIISKKMSGGKKIKAHRRKRRIEPGESAQIHQNIYAEEFPFNSQGTSTAGGA